MKNVINKVLIIIIWMLAMPSITKAYEVESNIYNFGSNNVEYFQEVIPSEDEGYVAIGYTYSSTIDDITNNGMQDGIIVKYDKNNNIIWKKNYGGSTYDSFNGIINCDDGYVVVGDSSSTNIEGITNKGSSDGIIVKYDKDGNILWQKNYGGSLSDSLYGIAVTTDGNYIAIGHTASFSINGITTHGKTDAILVMYDSDGNIIWEKFYGGNNDDYLSRVAATQDGGFITVERSFSTNIDGITNKGSSDAIIVKFDKNGNVEWQKSFGGSSEDAFYGIITSSDGGYVAVGHSESNFENINNKGQTDNIIVKYNSKGDIEWYKSYGGNNEELFYNVIETPDKGYIAVGYTASTDIEGLTNKGSWDILVVKYDKNGNVEWQKDIGGSSIDGVGKIIQTTEGKYILAGMSASEDTDYFINKGAGDAIILELIFKYNINAEESLNGTYEVKQDKDKGIITLNPNKGYILDTLTITNSKGEKLEYYEENGNYYFLLFDDVTVNVTYKEQIINPNTITFLKLGFLVIIIFAIYNLFISKKIDLKRYA